MSLIRIERHHTLGLPAARRLARRWAEKATRDYALHCSFDEGAVADRVHFSRSGVVGTLEVTAQRFGLELRLGLPMSIFTAAIEAKLNQKLDRQIEKALIAKQSPQA